MESSHLHHIERKKAESGRFLVSSAWSKSRERAADLLKMFLIMVIDNNERQH